jgi:hypothetical protein
MVGKFQQVVQVYFDDLDHQFDIQFLVLMHQDVSETDHFLESPGQVAGKDAIFRQQLKAFPAFLGDSQFPNFDQVVGQVDALLAGPLQIQGDGVLSEKIVLKGHIPRQIVVRANLLDAPFDAFLFVQNDIIHTS